MNIKGCLLTGVTAAWLINSKMALATDAAAPGEGMGLLTILFLAFGALIILMQIVPAFLMFGGMVSALLKRPAAKGEEASEGTR